MFHITPTISTDDTWKVERNVIENLSLESHISYSQRTRYDFKVNKREGSATVRTTFIVKMLSYLLPCDTFVEFFEIK